MSPPDEYRRTLTPEESDRVERRHLRILGKFWRNPKPNPDVERALVDAVRHEQSRRRVPRKHRRAS